jgi:hypothetical protein
MGIYVEVQRFFRDKNRWPTVDDLALVTELTKDDVTDKVSRLIEDRLVVMEGERVTVAEAAAGPVTSYKLTPEEIAAKYGAPGKAPVAPRAAVETIGSFPDRKPKQETQEENSMPRGQRIPWPAAADLMAMVDEIKRRGGDVYAELAEKFQCSAITAENRVGEARRQFRLEAAAEKAKDTTTDPTPGDVMREAEHEATAIAEGGSAAQDRTEDTVGGSGRQETVTALTEAHAASVPDELQPFRTMILIEQHDLQALPVFTHETEHVSRAPEKPGDEWPQMVRRNGFRTFRMWKCIAVHSSTCVMIPSGAVITEPSVLSRIA